MDKDRKEPVATHIERATSRLSGDVRRPSDESHVLIVDDNPLNAKLASAQLEQSGYEVTVVESGEAALAALALASYSLVLMDCGLPGMDGCDTTREIRRREASGHTVVVGFSSNTAESARAKCLEAGMDDYIARPVTASQLTARLRLIRSRSIAAAMPYKATERSDTVDTTSIDTLDVDVLTELAVFPGSDGSPLLVELTGIFLRNLPAMLRDLSEAAGASLSELTRSAHRLKSASTTIGGARLASLCEQIEEACRHEDSSWLGPLVIETQNEAGRLVEKLKEIPLC